METKKNGRINKEREIKERLDCRILLNLRKNKTKF